MNTGYYGYILNFVMPKTIGEYEIVINMDAEAERQIDSFIINEKNARKPEGGWVIRSAGKKDFERLISWLYRDGHIHNYKILKDKRRKRNETYTA